ncbi:GAF domain-containing protein [Streptomyces sp. NPDC005573]|uniref:GAF domain-containing protein n=1 Tax=Streptomyces sp. NPDC005573 TaxID=3156890 RepID=UPI0033B7C08D
MAPTHSGAGGSAATGELVSYRLRRERRLSSLYATARSLAALGEVDEVLASIVRHAHELIDSDIAYLSLLDAEGNLAIRASAGTISPEFRSARMPAGAGLGARVIESKAPFWVSDYREARVLSHHSAFDLLVPDEGLTALLGVPLLVGERVIGVLFAADRSARPFEKDEVALLCAFADHAAVALDNARLYEESRASLQRLQDAYRIIEDQVATVERAAAVHEALTQVVLTGGGPGDIAQLLVEQLRGAVTVLDRDDRLLAMRPCGEEVPGAGRTPARALLEEARATGRCVSARGADGAVHSVAALHAGGSHLGSLSLTRDAAPGPADVRMLERSAQIMGLLILMRDARAEAEERVRGELLTELLSRPPLHPAQRDRALARGVDVDHLDVLVVADCPGKATSDVVRRLNAVSAEWSGLAGEYLGRATMLLRADGPAARTGTEGADGPRLPDGAPRQEDAHRTDGAARAEKAARSEKAGRAERGARAERGGRAERAARAEGADRPVGAARAAEAGHGEAAARGEAAGAADTVEAVAQALQRRLRRALGAPVLVAADRVTGQEWPRSFALTRRCVEVMRALGETDRGATTRQFGMYALVFDPERAHDLDRFLSDSLGPLLDYDRRRSTDLVATTAAYFAHSGNLSRTARALHVHMNTLLKRLDRITALLGDGWRAPDPALRLHLAVRLHQLRSALDGEERPRAADPAGTRTVPGPRAGGRAEQ